MRHAHQLCSSSMSDLRFTILALGSNQAPYGSTRSAMLKCALSVMKSRGIHTVAASHFYESAPIGVVRQPSFVNAVVAVETFEPLGQLLRIIKQIERSMGRRTGVHWGPRVIDIDIVSFRGQCASGRALGWVDRCGRPTVMRRGQVIVPHPEMHRRSFVLRPLCDVMPHWRHPVFNKTAQQLLRKLPPNRHHRLTRLLVDHGAAMCDKRQ
jgi:2-amino-4-hydroxy-6-hydroxymethyldihydropteridine diphosphokinase